MKVVILAGGFGTRISEESKFRPKPLIEIGGMPILWHVMKIFYHQGFSEFIICGGYKSLLIKKFFYEYSLLKSDISINFETGTTNFINNSSENWTVSVIDTGTDSMTGGRLGRVRNYIKDEPFFMTYGDGVANVNLSELLKFHKTKKGAATLTSVSPPGRFGEIEIIKDRVHSFKEKPDSSNLINGGFFLLEPSVLDLIRSDKEVWEQYPLESLAKKGDLFAYKHEGFWHPMDTLKDQEYLDNLVKNNNAPWINW